MKKVLLTVVAVMILFTPVLAHHAAEGVVDEEIYATIDLMVSDTPHGDMTLEDLGGGMTEMTIIQQESLGSLFLGKPQEL